MSKLLALLNKLKVTVFSQVFYKYRQISSEIGTVLHLATLKPAHPSGLGGF